MKNITGKFSVIPIFKTSFRKECKQGNTSYCLPQDCQLVGNPEVGNPEVGNSDNMDHQDCQPQVLRIYLSLYLSLCSEMV